MASEVSQSVRAIRGLSTRQLVVMAASVCVAARLLAILVLFGAHLHYHRSFASLVTRFDGAFYQTIASHGYPHALPRDAHGAVLMNPVAFFPVFPLVTRALMAVTGLSFSSAALAVNFVCSVGATMVIAAIWPRAGENHRTALLAAALWTVWPIAYVSTIAYSDSVFCLLAAGALWALFRQRWLLAGCLAALAGATRPTGVVLALCCLYAAVARWRSTPAEGLARRVRPFVAVILAPVGILAYFLYLWLRTGRADAWFVTEDQGWRVSFDGGLNNLDRVGKYVHSGNAVGVGLVAVVGFCLILTILVVIQRVHPILAVWTVGLVLLAVTSRNDFSSVPRFLYPAFPLMLPIVRVVGNLRNLAVGAVYLLSALAAAGFGVYMTVFSHYPP